MTDNLIIREYRESDFSRIMDIEKSSFSSPWSEELMRTSLQGRLYTTYVAEWDGVVCAYVNLFTISGTLAEPVGDTEIMNIAVSSEYRRKRIADELIKSVLEHASSNHCSRIFLEVRESNIPAISLYKKHGFTEYGLRKNYYDHPCENAILMSYELNGELC